MTECDCVGPDARTATGECRVLSEARVTATAQERHRLVREEVGEATWRRYWERDRNGMPDARAVEAVMAARRKHRITPEDVDALHIESGLQTLGEARRRAIEARERDSDGQGMEWRLQRLGVPPRAILDMRRLQDTAAMDAAKKAHAIPAEMCPFLALLGEPGQGKTVAAAWMFREVARRTSPDLPTGTPEPLVWVQAATFTRLSAFSREDEQLLGRLRAARLLVLDDLGDEATPLGIGTAVELLKGREAAGRRSVVTSNLNPEKFRERYGVALWDRLHARGIVTGLKGQSMRRRT